MRRPLLPWFVPHLRGTRPPLRVGLGHNDVTELSVKSVENGADYCQLQGGNHSQLVIQYPSFLTIAAAITHEITRSVVTAIGILLGALIGARIRWQFPLVWGLR